MSKQRHKKWLPAGILCLALLMAQQTMATSTKVKQPQSPKPLPVVVPLYPEENIVPLTPTEKEELELKKALDYETLQAGSVVRFKEPPALKNNHGWYMGLGVGLSIRPTTYDTNAETTEIIHAYEGLCREYCPKIPVAPPVPPEGTPPPGYPNDVPPEDLRDQSTYLNNTVIPLSAQLKDNSLLGLSMTGGYTYRPWGIRIGLMINLKTQRYNNTVESTTNEYDSIAANCPEITCNGEIDSITGLPTDIDEIVVESPNFSLETTHTIYLTAKTRGFLDKVEFMIYKDFKLFKTINPYIGLGVALNPSITIDAHYNTTLAANYLPPTSGNDPHPSTGPDADSNDSTYDDLTAQQDVLLQSKYRSYIEPVFEAGFSINPNNHNNRTFIDVSYKLYWHAAAEMADLKFISSNSSQNSNPVDSSNPSVSHPSIIGAILGKQIVEADVKGNISMQQKAQHKIYMGIRYFVQ